MSLQSFSERLREQHEYQRLRRSRLREEFVARKKRMKEGVKADVYHYALQGAHKLSRNIAPGSLDHSIATAVGATGGAIVGGVRSLAPKILSKAKAIIKRR